MSICATSDESFSLQSEKNFSHTTLLYHYVLFCNCHTLPISGFICYFICQYNHNSTIKLSTIID